MAEQRLVNCVKLKKQLPGMDRPPVPGELGKEIYENVSKEAFAMFLDYFKMIVNEYRLDLSNPATDQVFLDQMKEYFFGTGGKLPDEFVPEDK
jgi:Fe-S cluster biosynthesis and repair protein YggX